MPQALTACEPAAGASSIVERHASASWTSDIWTSVGPVLWHHYGARRTFGSQQVCLHACYLCRLGENLVQSIKNVTLTLCFAHTVGPPTRPVSAPAASPPGSRGGSHTSSPTSLRSARSGDSASLQHGVRPPPPQQLPQCIEPEAAAADGSGGWEGSSSQSGQASHKAEALRQLLAMGFPRHTAVAALEAAAGDLESAVDILSG